LDQSNPKKKQLKLYDEPPENQPPKIVSPSSSPDREKCSERLNLFDLPETILAHLFYGGYFDTITTIQTLFLINKSVRELGMHRLKLLDVHCTSISALNLKNLAKMCPKICEIDASFCPNLSHFSFFSIFTIRKSLKILNLKGTDLSDHSLYGINDFQELEVLNMSTCKKVEIFLYFALGRLKKLKSLNLTGHIHLCDKFLFILVSNLKLLEDLDLSLCTKLTDKSIDALAGLKMLKRLSLRGLFNVRDQNVINIIADCSNIECLDLAHCRSISPLLIPHFKKCSSLKYICLDWSEGFKDFDFGPLRSSRPDMEIHCRQITWSYI